MSDNRLIPWHWARQPEGPDNAPLTLEGLQRQLNQFLETMWTKIGTHHHSVSGHVYEPGADLGESSNALEIVMDVPGLDDSDIDITVSANRIAISGEKKMERERKGWNFYLSERKRWNFYLSERTYGSFQRTFSLPPEAEPDKTTATLENGVLRVAIPKKPGASKRGRSIPITTKTKTRKKSGTASKTAKK